VCLDATAAGNSVAPFVALSEIVQSDSEQRRGVVASIQGERSAAFTRHTIGATRRRGRGVRVWASSPSDEWRSCEKSRDRRSARLRDAEPYRFSASSYGLLLLGRRAAGAGNRRVRRR
jgi:hypothetical protein